MKIVIDTSALVAVLLSEPERPALVRATQRADLLAPGSVHWEIGNALTALLRRRRLTLPQAHKALESYAQIPIRFVDIDLGVALQIASEHGLYAYDAYLIECSLAHRSPLLTLDKGLERAALAAGVEAVQVET